MSRSRCTKIDDGLPFVGGVLALVVWIGILLAVRSSPLRQGPHDRLASGTRVVRDSAS